MRATVGLLALLFLLPGATAAMTLELTPPTAPLAPVTETATIDWVATIDCSDLGGGASDPLGETVLHITPTAPASIALVGPMAHAVDTQPCLMDPVGTLPVSETFHVTIDQEAPALTDLPINVTATLQRPSTVEDPLDDVTANATASVQAAAYFHIQARLQEKIQETAGGTVVFEVEVTNFGNSPVDIETTLVDGPSGDAASWYQGADPLSLDWSGATSGQNATVEVLFELPPAGARTNEQAAFSIAVTPSHAGQTGDPVTSNVLIRHRGHVLSQDTPAPGAVWLVPAVAAVALALRRRAVVFGYAQ